MYLTRHGSPEVKTRRSRQMQHRIEPMGFLLGGDHSIAEPWPKPKTQETYIRKYKDVLLGQKSDRESVNIWLLSEQPKLWESFGRDRTGVYEVCMTCRVCLVNMSVCWYLGAQCHRCCNWRTVPLLHKAPCALTQVSHFKVVSVRSETRIWGIFRVLFKHKRSSIEPLRCSWTGAGCQPGILCSQKNPSSLSGWIPDGKNINIAPLSHVWLYLGRRCVEGRKSLTHARTHTEEHPDLVLAGEISCFESMSRWLNC